MFTPYSLLTEDCNYVLDSTGKASYKYVSHMWETTMSFSCFTLNSNNENFPEGITPPPNSRALRLWDGSRYWSYNAEANGQFDFRGGSDGPHVFPCSFSFSKDQMRWSPRSKPTDLLRWIHLWLWLFRGKPTPELGHKSEVAALTLHSSRNKEQGRRQACQALLHVTSFQGRK